MNYSGGQALKNGVVFYTKYYTVVSIYENNKIKTYERINSKSSTSKLTKIPFIRGLVYLLFSLNSRFLSFLFITFNLLLISFLIYCSIYYHSFYYVTNSFVFSSSWINFDYIILLIPLIFMTLKIKLTELGKYHAAEHMVAYTFDSGKELTLDNVKQSTRVNRYCGTNLLVFIIFIYMVLGHGLNINYVLSALIAYSIGYELHVSNNKFILILFKPFYLLSSLLQYTLFTSKPEDKHIKVALTAFKRLLELESNYQQYKEA